jgi:hypothetical protein
MMARGTASRMNPSWGAAASKLSDRAVSTCRPGTENVRSDTVSDIQEDGMYAWLGVYLLSKG